MTDKSTSEQDQVFSQQVQKAQHLLDAGKFDDAAIVCVSLAKTYPGQGICWLLLSTVSLALKKLPLAVDAALRAVQNEPNNPQYFMQVARCYLTNQDWQQARKALNYAQNIQSEKAPDLLTQLGTLLFEANQLDDALACYNQALQKDARHIASLYNRAAVRRFSGDNQGAEQDYRELLQQQPGDFEACHNLLQLRRYTRQDAMLALIDRCSELNPGNWRAQVQLGYARGKYLEDTKDYSGAFDAYANAATVKRQNSPYQLEKSLELMSRLPSAFDNHVQLTGVGHGAGEGSALSQSPEPIFVVGLPRTGTTLVERIISSHSEVVSGGELNSLPLALMESMGLNCFTDPFSITIDQCLSIKPEQYRYIHDRYLQLSLDRLGANTDTHYFLDKLPFNALYIGYILAAFPKAKILHLDRHPMDTAWSNFKMLFNHGYGYSYDLQALGAYIIAHQQMMDAWKSRFPENIYSVKYEALVQAPDQNIQRMLQHCQLAPERSCFEFHNNQAASQTASASQIRQPIYQSAAGHWKHFEPQLSSLKQMFTEAGLNI
ncbi:tetratricopeptide repeat protein [Aestuariicella hydrocarbonica]|uniref:Tetratricopeptide repeat protein n=1 Tax=Pseudomaricurvus hydrocarbonicus TaxID=1470433 RepID=A0A9E5JUR8_9GAMM|nr:sulfotransferase [Aestuariicella hydrocarbonica]NHO65836.1 tetratricopeptide repeat protein [Aestuariicella hydrocarbonica]